MSVTSSVSGAAGQAVREVAPWLERLARLGFAAKAVLYMTIGGLAAMAALGTGGDRGTDSRGAMAKLLGAPYGRVLLGVIALGLFGYAVWRIIEGLTDPEHRGRSAKGLALRLRSVATGLIHLGLAYSAVHFALGNFGQGQRGGGESKHWVARALGTPGGQLLLYAIAGGFIGYGLYQLYCAARSKLAKQLALGSLVASTRRWVIGASRFGIASRGVVFGMIGVLIARAATHRNAAEAGGVGESMRSLVELGKWPFVTIAIGLVAYGLYQAINARYRRIDVG